MDVPTDVPGLVDVQPENRGGTGERGTMLVQSPEAMTSTSGWCQSASFL